MTTQPNGLRFDIYERVHLTEHLQGIKELEGIELVPHIQVLPQGEQAVLRGNLLLSGVYLDQENRSGQTLEHLIPVEITLPLSRVSRVEDIAVDIENFDVDLLSDRSLNITGVLSLSGLDVPAAAAPTAQWQADENEGEVLFVHEAGETRSDDNAVKHPAVPSLEALEKEFWGYPANLEGAAPAGPTDEWHVPASEALLPGLWQTEKTAEAKQPQESPASGQAQFLDFVPPLAEADENLFEPPAAEEKKNLKVALGSKTAQEASASAAEAGNKPHGLTKLLNYAASKYDTRQAEEADAAGEAAPTPERVEWKKLLLSPRGDQQEFSKVRVAIVQKEETLETIAKRYDLNPREIALYNRLGDHVVSEGQLVYIPK